ncbi:V-type proton ATPase subunit S1-like protein [Sciurus carolinensis]|uniref:V-type proton ATPase subunit S1 n=1 Tax=Sciurus carolinensis TaxID=30640 RepID=A0AA41MYR1_SCICA|nr:V-type proton ATPase subunit S1-like protein [Sciurus carolinensis]
MASEVIKYEYHVLYSSSYQVPVLYFRASFLDGRPLALKDIWEGVHECYQTRLLQGPWDTITQQEHPILGQPFFVLHPCKTNEFMTPILKNAQKINRLSLKFGDDENPQSLDIRFFLTNYNKWSSQSWFSLHRVEIIFNNSVQATFNVTGIYAPTSYSYHCQRVSSLQQRDALLLPSDTDDVSSLWEVTFVDFQIQGFTIEGRQFAKARDCTSSFSPAVLIGLAMSLILLLVLAYALHMLIYLRYLDRHYEFITSPAHFPPLKARDMAEEKELLRSQGIECYELRSQQICKIYV